MIWPEFLDDNGNPIDEGIPCIGTLTARMHIAVADNASKHFERLEIGSRFYCMEGHMITALGTVIKLSI